MPDELKIHSESDDEYYDDLVARALDRMEREGLSGVQAFLREHPEHQEVLRARLATLHSVGLVSGTAVPKDGVPERLGEFRLLEKLGGGGMGVVYVAEQESLGRRVALKLVRPDLLYFPGARERFQREVQSIARLSHPAIVPVYSVGEDSGVPWFAMELVHGATVNECIELVAHRTPRELRAEDLGNAVTTVLSKRSVLPPRSDSDAAIHAAKSPSSDGSDSRVRRSESSDSLRIFHGSWPAACARVMLRAAEAVAHAHERGVLHRDLKPSNLMLTRSGRVLLFDFGLATAEGSHQITRSGIRLGSLAYMSPEQVDGDASSLDERSDIWSLGVSLYEMLTLPFRGESGDAIASAIRICQPTPPRRLNPAIPEDLETVVLTALDRDPTRRYPTAKALADDLTNVLELRPIQARRPGTWLRARRFVQRHPAASLALALGLVVVIGGPSLVIWEQRKSLAKEQEAARRVRDALARAESNLDLALNAVETMLFRVGDKALKDVPQADPVRRALLLDAERFYAELRATQNVSRETDLKAVHGLTRLMYLYLGEGDWDSLESIARRIVEEAKNLIARYPESGDPWIFLSQGHEGLEAFHRFNGGPVEALEEAKLSLEAAEYAQQRTGLKPVPVVVLAGAIDRLARALVLNADRDGAERQYRRAIDVMRILRDAEPDEPEIAQRLTMALNNCADFLSAARRYEEAYPLLDEAVTILRGILERQPDSAETIVAAATCDTNLAHCLAAMKRTEEAKTHVRRAFDRLSDFAAKYPERLDGLQAWTSAGSTLGTMLVNERRYAEGVEVLRPTTEGYRRLLAIVPGSADVQRALVVCCINRSHAERRAGDPDVARTVALDGLSYFESQGRRPQSDPMLYRSLKFHLAHACVDLGDHAAAARESIALAESLPDDGIALRYAGICLARSLDPLARDPALEGEAREAALAERAAQAVSYLARGKAMGAVRDVDLDGLPDYAPLRARPEFAALRALPEGNPPK